MGYVCALFLILAVPAEAPSTRPSRGEPAATVKIERGDLSVLFRDNSESPGVLSGVDSLFNTRDAPGFDAYDPDSKGASAGLNFEHIISGHRDAANAFAPRLHRYTLYRLPDARSVVLERRREDDPWSVSSTMKYTVTEPHYIDLEFECVPHDAGRFGKRGYAIFFWANYMNEVADVPIRFRGVAGPGSPETWIAADGPPGHPDWNQGGTYRHVRAAPLEYDDDHNFKLNSWSYDRPRYTKPFYFGRAARDMVFLIMFDRGWTHEDEIRFSIFKFKLGTFPRPAWDFQYVIHRVEENRRYGYRARVVWKKFVSADDCLREYEDWVAGLQPMKVAGQGR